MKLNRILLGTAVVAALTSGAVAQVRGTGQHRPRAHSGTVVRPANSQALAALQSDLAAAIQSMEAALPIYDGYRVKSIHATHRALGIVDKALVTNAAARQASKAKDHIPSGNARGRYNSEQISQSQSNMRQGLAALMTAEKDLQAAAGSNPNKQALEVQKLIAKAVQDANTAVNIHASQG